MSDINITCQTSSGKMLCRYKSYSNEYIPKGEPYLNIEGTSAAGSFKIGICKAHSQEVLEMMQEAMKDFHIRSITGI